MGLRRATYFLTSFLVILFFAQAQVQYGYPDSAGTCLASQQAQKEASCQTLSKESHREEKDSEIQTCHQETQLPSRFSCPPCPSPKCNEELGQTTFVGMPPLLDEDANGGYEMQFLSRLVGDSASHWQGSPKEKIQVSYSREGKEGTPWPIEPFQCQAPADGERQEWPLAWDDATNTDGNATPSSTTSTPSHFGLIFRFHWFERNRRCGGETADRCFDESRRGQPDRGIQASPGEANQRETTRSFEASTCEQTSEHQTQHPEASGQEKPHGCGMAKVPTSDDREIQSPEGSLLDHQKPSEQRYCRESGAIQSGCARNQVSNADREQYRSRRTRATHQCGQPSSLDGSNPGRGTLGSDGPRQPCEKGTQEIRRGQRTPDGGHPQERDQVSLPSIPPCEEHSMMYEKIHVVADLGEPFSLFSTSEWSECEAPFLNAASFSDVHEAVMPFVGRVAWPLLGFLPYMISALSHMTNHQQMMFALFVIQPVIVLLFGLCMICLYHYKECKRRSRRFQFQCQRRFSQRLRSRSHFWGHTWRTRTLFVYLILWHHLPNGAQGMGSTFGLSANTPQEDPCQHHGEDNYQFSTARGTHLCFFRLWTHRAHWASGPFHLDQLMHIDTRECPQCQLQARWRHGDDFENFKLSKLWPTTRSMALHFVAKEHLIAIPNYTPCFLAPLLVFFRNTRRERTGSILVPHLDGQISTEVLFDLLYPDHRCDLDETCFVQVVDETSDIVTWPSRYSLNFGNVIRAIANTPNQEDTLTPSSQCSTFLADGSRPASSTLYGNEDTITDMIEHHDPQNTGFGFFDPHESLESPDVGNEEDLEALLQLPAFFLLATPGGASAPIPFDPGGHAGFEGTNDIPPELTENFANIYNQMTGAQHTTILRAHEGFQRPSRLDLLDARTRTPWETRQEILDTWPDLLPQNWQLDPIDSSDMMSILDGTLLLLLTMTDFQNERPTTVVIEVAYEAHHDFTQVRVFAFEWPRYRGAGYVWRILDVEPDLTEDIRCWTFLNSRAIATDSNLELRHGDVLQTIILRAMPEHASPISSLIFNHLWDTNFVAICQILVRNTGLTAIFHVHVPNDQADGAALVTTNPSLSWKLVKRSAQLRWPYLTEHGIWAPYVVHQAWKLEEMIPHYNAIFVLHESYYSPVRGAVTILIHYLRSPEDWYVMSETKAIKLQADTTRENLLEESGYLDSCTQRDRDCQVFCNGRQLTVFGRTLANGDFCAIHDRPNEHFDDCRERSRSPRGRSAILPGHTNIPDEQSFMMTRRDTTFRVRYSFLYLANSPDPVILQRFDDEIVPGATLFDKIVYQYRFSTEERQDHRIVLYFLQTQPPDLAAFRAEGFIARDANDDDTSKRLTLVDIDFFKTLTLIETRQLPKDGWRETVFLPSSLTRLELLRRLGLLAFCGAPADICEITLRGIRWPSADTQTRPVSDGDFVTAKIYLHDQQTPLPTQWLAAQNFEASTERSSAPATQLGATESCEQEESEDETMDEVDSDNSSLLQVAVLSFPSFARERLPPPGNGPKRVSFDTTVEVFDNDVCCRVQDNAITNRFTMAFLEDLAAFRDNPFVNDFLWDMRFDQDTDDPNVEHDDPQSPSQDLSPAHLPLESVEPIFPFETTLDDPGHTPEASVRTISLEKHLGDKIACPNFERCTLGEKIDMRPAISIREIFCSHCVLPHFELSLFPWKPDSLPWLSLPPWVLDEVTEFHLYSDGSFHPPWAGAGICLFVLCRGSWFFGGYIGCDLSGLPNIRSSYETELFALTLAGKWAHDLIKLQKFHFDHCPPVFFHFDSHAAGFAAAGDFGGSHDNIFFVTMRAIFHVLEYGLQVTTEFVYTKAHAHDPGNEAADVIASCASKSFFPQDAFWLFLFHVNQRVPLQWLWWTFTSDMTQLDSHGFFHLPKPEAQVQQSIVQKFSSVPPATPSSQTVWLDLTILSYNVNSINDASRSIRHPHGRLSIGKAESLLKNFHLRGVHFFTLQETRLQQAISPLNPWYFLVQHPANSRGQGGIIFGVSKSLGVQGARSPSISEESIRIVHVDTEFLVVHIKDTTFRCCFVVCHAPHQGLPDATILRWWRQLDDQILQKFGCEDPLILMGDMNARIGSILSEHVGPHQPDPETLTGQALHQFLQQWSLWLPCTWPEHHLGEAGTWYHSNGTPGRLDYCALPLAWRDFTVSTQSLPELSLRDLHDHVPTILHCQGMGTFKSLPAPNTAKPKRIDFSDPAVLLKFEKAFEHLPPADWQCDVHLHAEHLQNCISTASLDLATTRFRRRKRGCLQNDTWDQITNKQSARKLFYSSVLEKRRHFLACFFWAWRNHFVNYDYHAKSFLRMSLECQRHYSLLLRLGNQVNTMIRRDEKLFYENLSSRFRDCDRPGFQKELWREVKKVKPSTREKARQIRPGRLTNLDPKWVPHLCHTEAGVEKPFSQVYAECVTRQNRTQSMDKSLEELPTLLQIEDVLHQAKCGKAPGLDDITPDLLHFAKKAIAKDVWSLALKEAAWCTEPIQHKGGSLVFFPKKGDPLDPASYRTISLMSCIAKQIHKLYRPILMNHLSTWKEIGQIGGFAAQETLFGSHYVRGLLSTAFAAKIPCGILFIDLKNAYHSLLRGMALGQTPLTAQEREAILDSLADLNLTPDEQEAIFQQPGVLADTQTPKYLQALLTEYGQNNWSRVFQSTVQTLKGTRPGSPIADSVFSILIGKAAKEIATLLTAEAECHSVFEKLQIPNLPILWADDLAVACLSHSNQGLEQCLARVASKIQEIFRTKGMRMNFAQHKTEALITYVGSQAPVFRRQLLDCSKNSLPLLAEENAPTFLKLTTSYKHLGVLLSSGGDLLREIQHRIGQAWTAWRSLRRQIFTNRNLKPKTRLELCFSLVMSKLFYGSGAWPLLTSALLRKLQTCYHKIIRATVGELVHKNSTQRRTDEAILAQYRVPTVRVRLAQERLTYARRLHLHASGMLSQLLDAEDRFCPNSWFAGVRADFEWLAEINGNAWGQSLEEARSLWHTKSGWKNFIRKAVERHTLQEACANALPHSSTTSTPISTSQSTHSCYCEATFTSYRGLRVHQVHAHGDHCPEFELCPGTRCIVCLREFWSVQRLKQHLQYAPRDRKPNLCFTLLTLQRTAKPLSAFEFEDDSSHNLPFAGLRRRESLRCSGPLRFGAQWTDFQWATLTKEKLEYDLSTRLGISDLSSAFYEDFQGPLDEVLVSHPDHWEDALRQTALQISDHYGEAILNFTYWGACFSWTCAHDYDRWLTLLHTMPLGPEVFEWFDLGLKQAFATRIALAAPHRPVQTAPANDRERLQAAAQIPRSLKATFDLLSGSTDVSPATVFALAQLVKPGASLRALKRRLLS